MACGTRQDRRDVACATVSFLLLIIIVRVAVQSLESGHAVKGNMNNHLIAELKQRNAFEW